MTDIPNFEEKAKSNVYIPRIVDAEIASSLQS